MKRITHLTLLSGTAALLVATLPTFGSGTYCACMPKPPPKSAQTVDRDKFDLGQKVFNEKTAPVQGDPTGQRTRLAALQAQLPEKVAKKKDLTQLAGKITDQQLDALEYFIKERYPTK